jgi:hypothetical protein
MPIPPPPDSSSASATALVRSTERSRSLALWWLLLHLTLGAAVAAVDAGLLAKLVLGAAVAAHAVARRPRGRPLLLALEADGRWSLPELGLFGLEARAGSAHTTSWIRVVLAAGGRAFDILLLEDEFERTTWRVVQMRLNSTAAPDSRVLR